MAALTPASTFEYSMGNVSLLAGRFSSGNTGDTWTVAGGIIAAYAQMTSVPSSASVTGINLSVSGAVITLRPGEDGKAFTVFVMKGK